MGGILREKRQGHWHKVLFFCPTSLDNRPEIVEKIGNHGGLAEHRISEAEVLLASENDETGNNRYRSLLPKIRLSDARLVDERWLEDSISAGVMQDCISYYPKYLDEVTPLPREATASQMKATRVRLNERQ